MNRYGALQVVKKSRLGGQLLMNFEDPVGDVFVDEMGNYTLTDNDNARHSTNQAAFGLRSMWSPGTGDYLRVEGSDAANELLTLPSTSDWTVEMWVYYTTAQTGNRFHFSNRTVTPSTVKGYSLFCNNRVPSMTFWNGDGSVHYAANSSGGAISTLDWHQLMWVHEAAGDKYYMFVDGVEVSNVTTAQNGTYDGNSGTKVHIATDSRVPGSTTQFFGHTDALRVWDTALFTSNFTLPTSPPNMTGGYG